MGTQFQGLTASRAWGPEAVQADLARNLERERERERERAQAGEG